jgi:hypothetical protein
MNLEHQVCNLELAKRLKELGVKQKSLYVWKDQSGHGYSSDIILFEGDVYDDRTWSAFNVAELGELIGTFRNEWAQGWDDSGCFWRFQFGGRGCGSMMDGFGEKFDALEEHTEADARAALLIHLVEQRLANPI